MRSEDRGSASLWMVAAIALLVAISTVAVIRAQGVLARHRAEAAADFAALAGALRIGTGGDPCAAAAAVARANAAAMSECTSSIAPDGRSGVVQITTTSTVELPILGGRAIRASARAARDPTT